MRTGPSFDATLLHAEDEDSAGLDHGSALGVGEAPCYAWDDALSCGMDEA
jgi:hypothetical protein